MAKRKRLTLPEGGTNSSTALGDNETRNWLTPGLSAPPIAQVAGDASAIAALRDVSEAMATVRSEGRLVARLALDSIEDDHLLRDRLEADSEGHAALVASIRNHGQRMPIEVTEIGPDPSGAIRYGLISGWRRLAALRALVAETGEARFTTVLALVRHPVSPAEAYVAMVEENEVRLGVSHYERARIVARAADLGVFADERAALSTLFASASRPRRSKIGSFLAVYRALDGALRFPAALPERLGLRLAKLAATGDLAALAQALRADPPATAEAEHAFIVRFVSGVSSGEGAKGTEAPTLEVRPGVYLVVSGGSMRPVLTLSGPAVDSGFRERLMSWLEADH